ncbi:hypothetical protein GCM10027578_02510 [Spirosoma luteolum]
MKKILFALTFPLWMSGFVYASPIVSDSIGVEKKDGKRFILHRVDQGQTLYAIARRYGRSVAAIQAANPGLGNAVRFDQTVRIPIPEKSLSPQQAKAIDKAIQKEEKAQDQVVRVAAKAADPVRTGIHVVEKGQTLYSLAARYGVSQADLRRWNNLPSGSVLIGQALIVSEKAHLERSPGPSVATTAPAPPATAVKTTEPSPRPTEPKPTETKPAEPKPTESRPTESRPTESRPVAKAPEPARTAPKVPAESAPARPDKTSTPAEPKATTPPVVVELPRPGNDAPMPTRGRRVSLTGVAEMIDGADGSGKYLALHRTAPIGTLVQVRNAFNNQSLWVKVIGRLPDTGVNDKILIKLSQQAFAKLSPDDRRFRAEVSYIAP